jgi:hypothetical protein
MKYKFSLLTINNHKKMNTDTIINLKHIPKPSNINRQKCICIYNITLFINDLIILIAFSMVVFCAYLIYKTAHSDYTECNSTKYLKLSSYVIGTYAIIIFLIYALMALFVSRPKFINDKNSVDARIIHLIFIYPLACIGPIILGSIMATTGNLYKTYDSQGCDDTLYGMSFVGLYLVCLIVWIFGAIGITLISLAGIIYGIGYLIYCIGYLMYVIIMYLIKISCRDVFGCYIKYDTDQPTECNNTECNDTGKYINLPYNTECPVCLTHMIYKNACTFNVLSCNHAICKTCFNQMSTYDLNVKCPLCRVTSTTSATSTAV